MPPCRSSSSFPQPKDGAPQPSRTPDRTRSRYQTARSRGRGPRHISRRQFNMLRRRAAIPMIATIRCALTHRRAGVARSDQPHSRTIGSMLRGIRTASSGWLGKAIMIVVVGFLVISFGIWGIGDIFRGYTRGALVTVGDAKMSADQFRQLFNTRLQALSRQVQ